MEWATAHSGVESQYNTLYRDRQGWEAHNRCVWPGKLGHNTARKRATTWRSWAATRSVPLAIQPSARDKSFCIVTQALCRDRGGAALVLVQPQLCHDTVFAS